MVHSVVMYPKKTAKAKQFSWYGTSWPIWKKLLTFGVGSTPR